MKRNAKKKVVAALLTGIMLIGSGFSMKEASAMEQQNENGTQKKAVKVVQTAGRDQLGDFATSRTTTMMSYSVRSGARTMCSRCTIAAS